MFIYSPEGSILSKSTWETTSNNHNKIIWRKLYAKVAKPDGTTEKIDGKYDTWTLGEKFELKMSDNVKMNVDTVK